jgi:hypothetical protein
MSHTATKCIRCRRHLLKCNQNALVRSCCAHLMRAVAARPDTLAAATPHAGLSMQAGALVFVTVSTKQHARHHPAHMCRRPPHLPWALPPPGHYRALLINQLSRPTWPNRGHSSRRLVVCGQTIRARHRLATAGQVRPLCKHHNRMARQSGPERSRPWQLVVVAGGRAPRRPESLLSAQDRRTRAPLWFRQVSPKLERHTTYSVRAKWGRLHPSHQDTKEVCGPNLSSPRQKRSPTTTPSANFCDLSSYRRPV